MAKPNPLTEYATLLSDIEKGNTQPLYLLDGEESYFIDKLTEAVEHNVLDESVREYSLFTYYGSDITQADLISACHQSSFLSPNTVVIVKEAQSMKGFDKMYNYFSKPNPNCTLVVAYKNKKVDSRTKAFKAITKNGKHFHSRKLYDNETKNWIQEYVTDLGYKIAPTQTEILYSYLGNDLSKLAHEIDKIGINLEVGDEITQNDIEKYIGISKEYNTFALTKAITDRNSKELYRVLAHFESNPKTAPFMVVLATLTNYYLKILQYHTHSGKDKFTIASILKINPYFVGDYTKAARNIDPTKARSSLALLYDYNKKAIGIGSNTKPEKLLTELVVRLFHA